MTQCLFFIKPGIFHNLANISIQQPEIGGQFRNGRAIIRLNLLQFAEIAARDKINAAALATPASRAPDAVQIRVHVARHVKVDHRAHLLNVNAARRHVGGNEHAMRPAAKLLVRLVAHVLLHAAVNAAHGKPVIHHRLRQIADTANAVAVNDALRHGNAREQVLQRGVLVVVRLQRHVELADALQREHLALHQNAHRIAHELVGQRVQLGRHGGAEQAHLHVRVQLLKNIVNLLVESRRQHFIGFVQNQHLHSAPDGGLTAQDVVHTAGATDDDLRAVGLQVGHIVLRGGSADEELHVEPGHLRTQVLDDVVNLLGQLARGRNDERLRLFQVQPHPVQRAGGECAGLAAARLRLSNDVSAVNDGQNGLLLNGAGLLKTVAVYAAHELRVQIMYVFPCLKFPRLGLSCGCGRGCGHLMSVRYFRMQRCI
jgi:hypothetical protein